jgi:hypothetical protein
VPAAAAASAVVVIAHSGGSSTGKAPSVRGAVSVNAALDPDTVEFGDPVTATVTVLLDRGVRPSDVRVQENLAPLTQLGQTRVTDVTRDGGHTIIYSATATCLDEGCLSTTGSRSVALRPAVVRARGLAPVTAVWPVLQVRQRVTRADAARTRPPLRSDTTPPPVGYRLAPARLARVLEVAAAVLAAAAVLLAAWTAAGLKRRRRRPAALTGIERALALAREAERRPPPDRRRAVGLLARLLGSRDAELADAADDVAWSASAPTPDAVSKLVTRVEHEVDGG